jgi:hypothetical protein
MSLNPIPTTIGQRTETQNSSRRVSLATSAIILFSIIPAVEATFVIRTLFDLKEWSLFVQEVAVLGLVFAYLFYSLGRPATANTSEESLWKSRLGLIWTVVIFAVIHHAYFNVISVYGRVIFAK